MLKSCYSCIQTIFLWNLLSVETRTIPKRAFKIQIKRMLFSIFEVEEDYVEASILIILLAS